MRMRAVWITPLLRVERLREQVKRYGGPSLFAIGTADWHYDPTFLAEVQQATKGEVVVVEGADHGLDVPGDVVASVKAVEQVIQALQAFLAR